MTTRSLYYSIHIIMAFAWMGVGSIYEWDGLRTALWVGFMAFVWDKTIHALARALAGR